MNGLTFDQLWQAFVAQLAIVAALFVWGRWVAKRRGGVWWRRATWLPWIAFVLGTMGAAIAAHLLFLAFDVVAHVSPAERATLLARGISDAMTRSAPLFLLSWAAYLTSFIAFVIGTLRAPPPKTA